MSYKVEWTEHDVSKSEFVRDNDELIALLTIMSPDKETEIRIRKV